MPLKCSGSALRKIQKTPKDLGGCSFDSRNTITYWTILATRRVGTANGGPNGNVNKA